MEIYIHKWKINQKKLQKKDVLLFPTTKKTLNTYKTLIFRILHISIFILSIVSFEAMGQSADNKKGIKDDWYIEPVLRGGRVVPNFPGTNLWDIHLYGMDLRVGKQTYGKAEWEQWFGYPEYGLTLRYGHFTDKLLQDKLALFWYIGGNFYETKRVSFKYQFGSGLAYFFNPYHPTVNPENYFIGSHLNAHIDLHLALEFKLSDRVDLALRGNFSHSSNGAIRFPNYGINPLSGQLGVKYHFNSRPERIYTIDTITSFQPKNSFYFYVAPGWKQSKKNFVYGTDDKYSCKTTYLTTTLQLGYYRQFHPKYRYGGGIDIMYSSELRTHFPVEQRNELKYITSAAFVSFEFLYNRFVLHTAIAAYVYRSADFYEWYYERVGFKILLGKHKNHFAALTIKAHAGMIDYIEWGYGLHFINWHDKKARTLRRHKQ